MSPDGVRTVQVLQPTSRQPEELSISQIRAYNADGGPWVLRKKLPT